MLCRLIIGHIQAMEIYYLIFKTKNEGTLSGTLIFVCYELAATAVVVATATAIVSGVGTAATAAAAEDEDKDDYPRAIVTTKVTHL